MGKNFAALMVLIFLIGPCATACHSGSKPKQEEKSVSAAITVAVENILEDVKKAREEARADAKAAAEDRAATAADAAEARKSKAEAEAAKIAAENARADAVRITAMPKPAAPVCRRRPPAQPRVSATSLAEDLSSDNPSSVDEAVVRLPRRLDTIPELLKTFAMGDVSQKRRVWAAIRQMDGARTYLSDIAANPDRWEARIVGAARQILIGGFHQDLEAEDYRANMARCSEQVYLMIANLNAKTRELRDINIQLLNLAQYGKLKDAEQARELERIRDDYKLEIATLRGELESKGIKVIYTAIQIPVPVPIPQVQMVYPQCR